MRDSFADEDEIIDEDSDTKDPDEDNNILQIRSSKAWRSIERYREMKELRKHLEDFMFDDIPGKHLKDLHL